MDNPIANISYTYSGVSLPSQDTKVIYDPDLTGYHIWNANWSSGLYNESNGPAAIYISYQFWSGTLNGFVHLDTATAIAIPSSLTANWLYGPDIFRANGTWYMLASYQVSPVSTVVLSGSSPSRFPTLVATDSTRDAEGVCWFFLGDRIYAIAGSPRAH